jgi:Ni2+-binding GTPase involved in maturation of urease and hydrogenase
MMVLIRVDKSQGSGKGSLLMEELKKNKDSLNGLVVDHENDVKQNKSTINRLVVLCQKWIVICKEMRIENQKYRQSK